MANKKPQKPKTMREQVDSLWETVINDYWHRLYWMDKQQKFIMGFLTIIVVLLAVLLATQNAVYEKPQD